MLGPRLLASPSCPTHFIPKIALIPSKRQTNKQHLYLILEGQKKIPEANQVRGLWQESIPCANTKYLRYNAAVQSWQAPEDRNLGRNAPYQPSSKFLPPGVKDKTTQVCRQDEGWEGQPTTSLSFLSLRRQQEIPLPPSPERESLPSLSASWRTFPLVAKPTLQRGPKKRK